MQKKWLWYLLAGLALLGVVVVIVFYASSKQNQTYHGSVITPPADAADFTLTNQKNETTVYPTFAANTFCFSLDLPPVQMNARQPWAC